MLRLENFLFSAPILSAHSISVCSMEPLHSLSIVYLLLIALTRLFIFVFFCLFQALFHYENLECFVFLFCVYIYDIMCVCVCPFLHIYHHFFSEKEYLSWNFISIYFIITSYSYIYIALHSTLYSKPLLTLVLPYFFLHVSNYLHSLDIHFAIFLGFINKCYYSYYLIIKKMYIYLCTSTS